MIGSRMVLTGGFDGLIKDMTNKTERGILRAALRRTGQQVTVKEARRNLKGVGAARYVKNVIVKTTVTARQAVAMIGARKGSPLSKIGHLIEGGTKRHVITPKKAKVMVSRDGIFRGRRVNHPGTTARPWLNPALNNKRRAATSKFAELVRAEILKAAAKARTASAKRFAAGIER